MVWTKEQQHLTLQCEVGHIWHSNHEVALGVRQRESGLGEDRSVITPACLQAALTVFGINIWI